MNGDTPSTPEAEASYQRQQERCNAKPVKKRGPHQMPTVPDDVTCPLCGIHLPTNVSASKPGTAIVTFTPGALRHLSDNHITGI